MRCDPENGSTAKAQLEALGDYIEGNLARTDCTEIPVIGFPQFGQTTNMLARSLSGDNLAGGGLDPLYQFGGPRSIQLALKLAF